MSHNLALLQLAFNLLVLLALLILARNVWRTPEAPAGRRTARARPAAPVATARATTVRALANAPAPLDELVARVEQQELAAEAALRSRLARYRDHAAGA